MSAPLQAHILVVEDDAAVAAALGDALRREGFLVTHEGSVAAAEAAVAGKDLVLLDWMLPDGQGVDLLRRWRQRGLRLPVILLTARADVVDKVVGLELGADDYLTKPFDPRELVARIRVRLRGAGARPEEEAPHRHLGLAIDLNRREASFEGVRLELTRMEFELLRLFVDNPGHVFTREEILNRVWGYDSYPTTRTVDTHVLQLRNKTKPELFETVRGVGYRLVEELAAS